ncbi:MAG TPA: hypothetical protein VFK88_01085 [Gallionella sp.]|nr:hypothetical protein [Gallionella sp.]
MNTPVALTLLALCLGLMFLNIRASIRVSRFSGSEPSQRLWQHIFVWCLPLAGALVVLTLLRDDVTQWRRESDDAPREEDFLGGSYSGPSQTLFRERSVSDSPP